MCNVPLKLAFSLLLGFTAAPAIAGLYAVDQTSYTAPNGFFAAWYQDTYGHALDLCLSRATSSRGTSGSMCNLLPSDNFDPDQPIIFPDNFPDEAFWFAADATVTGGGITLSYGAAVEAAFSSEQPVAGNQISFARIRIRASVPVIGSYTITHPYGVEVFDVNTLGPNAISLTRDIGLGAPGEFQGALAGDIGPFLRSVNGPYTAINPDTGREETFVGDPNLLEAVTGSPFETNFVRIEGPNGLNAQTSTFTITGKLSEVELPTPLLIKRATYSRSDVLTDAGTSVAANQQDFFTLAPPAPASQTYTDSASVRGAMQASTGGAWYGQSDSPITQGEVSFTADNSVAVPSNTPTTKTAALIDVVTISRAEYSMATQQLTVEASSSDQSGQTVLSVESLDDSIELTDGRMEIDLPMPPATVRVSSTNGGSDTEEVVIIPIIP